MDGEDLSVVLERCLVDLQAGVPLEAVLQKYPEWQDELRPVLEAVLSIWEARGSDTVPIAAMTRSRARLMREIQRKQEVAPKTSLWEKLGFRRLRPVPIAALLLIFSIAFTGLASARALPGEPLYPVKITAEQVGLSLPGSPSSHLERQETFDQNRLAEVATLIARQSIQKVSFSGYLMRSADGWHISGINLDVPAELASQFESLLGSMVMIEADLTPDGKTLVTGITPWLYNFSGKLTTVENNRWKIDDVWVEVSAQAPPAPGQQVQVQVMRLKDNQLQAVRVETEGHTYTDQHAPDLSKPQSSQTAEPTKAAEVEGDQPGATLSPTRSSDGQPTRASSSENNSQATPDPKTSASGEDTKTRPSEGGETIRPSATRQTSASTSEKQGEPEKTQSTPYPTKTND